MASLQSVNNLCKLRILANIQTVADGLQRAADFFGASLMAATLEADPGQCAVGVAGALVPHLVHHGAVQVLQEVGRVEARLLLDTLSSHTLGAGGTGGIHITTSMTLHHILNKTE